MSSEKMDLDSDRDVVSDAPGNVVPQKTRLKFSVFKLWGQWAYTYEDVQDIIKKNVPQFVSAFETLFTNADRLEFHDYKATARRYPTEYDEVQKMIDCDRYGQMLVLALQMYYVEERPSKSPDFSDTLTKPQLRALRDGFIKEYIDPHSYVQKIASKLSANMDQYIGRDHGTYVAPYTSLVTSSMMGKTRMMKELTQFHPLIYICFRKHNSTGYPRPTAEFLTWFQRGACGPLGINQAATDIKMDNNFYIATLRHSLFLLFLFEELGTLITDKSNELRSNGLNLEGFEWMWYFFAEPSRKLEPMQRTFWKTVTKNTDAEIDTIWDEASPEGSTEPNPEWARDWLQDCHPDRLRKAHGSLLAALARLTTKPSASLTLILCFDEARHLCNTSAVAMRRVLQFLRQASRTNPSLTPRVFGLFTDTTSRLTNFQPRSCEDISSRDTDFPPPGDEQFDPIYLFTSIDAFARAEPDGRATSNHKDVAKPERLLKFGRAGWYSLYSGKSKGYNKDKIMELAVSKLLGGVLNVAKLRSDAMSGSLSQKLRLRLFAVLAPRLALTVGPFTAEASEIVSSHLAVLLNTDSDRHFLQTYYPSEPVLAEASAVITSSVGWDVLLRGLYHQIRNGVVSPGYRGGLLSKVLCLMAMDDTRKPFSDDVYWKNSQPVKVSEFLDRWLRPPERKEWEEEKSEEERSFSSNWIDFMNGYVFFTHFIRVSENISFEMLVSAWNRGAAIMPMQSEGFGHDLPVMLVEDETQTPNFGQPFQPWTDDQLAAACSNVSFILINSKNYGIDTGPKTAVLTCRPTEDNFADYLRFSKGDPTIALDDGPTSVYLSIIQDFGPPLDSEEYVNFPPRGINMILEQTSSPGRQINIILKGLRPETYQCLLEESDDAYPLKRRAGDDRRVVKRPRKRKEAIEYLEKIKLADVDFLEDVMHSRDAVIDYLPPVFKGNSEADKSDMEWKKLVDQKNLEARTSMSVEM